MDEILHGPMDPRSAAMLVESGNGTFQLDCVTDSKNIVAAIEVTKTTVPAEKNFYFHLLWLKDRLKSGAVRALVWRDTRDITADGHTKGSIDRKALRSCAGGTFEHVHAEHRLVLSKTNNRTVASEAGQVAIADLGGLTLPLETPTPSRLETTVAQPPAPAALGTSLGQSAAPQER
jgi:hypothetical protein